MSKGTIVFVLGLGMALALGLSGCGGSSTSTGPFTVGTETAADVWTEDTGTTKPTVVDVRVETDYATSHLPYAVNWPFAVEPSGVGPFTKIIVVGTNDTDGGAATLMLTGAAPTLNRMIGGMNGYTYGLDYSPDYVESKLGTGQWLQIIDVRDATTFATAHIPGAVNDPLTTITTWGPTLTSTAHYLMVCQAGVRSATARDDLAVLGFTHVDTMAGGMNAWTYATATGP
jgi:rhodanese-related sulfurtransferase